MVSSARQAITSLLFVFSIAVCLQAQTTTPKVTNASISGKVIFKGKPAVGVMVGAKEVPSYNDVVRYRARTDRAGNYRIADLPAGTYEIFAVTPALVTANQSGSVAVSEGEEVEDVNLSLVPGGVITGKITDADGEPLIGQQVNITQLYVPYPRPFSTTVAQLFSDDYKTDDRGVYRAFGLPPGKYRVSVGDYNAGKKSSGEYYVETFYRSAGEAMKASVIEVTEGSEANNIDIVLGRPIRTFKVTGRVVDRDTGQPVPMANYGQSSKGSSSLGNDFTNANGEFRLENLSPGRYTVFTSPARDVFYSGSVSFEVVDRDLTDLVIRATKGSRLSGVVVVDGYEKTPHLLRQWMITAVTPVPNTPNVNPPSDHIRDDGRFEINGVKSGSVSIYIFGGQQAQAQIVRIEHNGIPLPESFRVKEGDQFTDLRIIVKYVKRTAAIRGVVRVEKGELPPVSQLSLSVLALDENLQPQKETSFLPPQLDARGRFYVEGLPAGTYRVSVSILRSGQTGLSNTTTQQVIVTDDTVSDVTLIIKPQSNPN